MERLSSINFADAYDRMQRRNYESTLAKSLALTVGGIAISLAGILLEKLTIKDPDSLSKTLTRGFSRFTSISGGVIASSGLMLAESAVYTLRDFARRKSNNE